MVLFWTLLGQISVYCDGCKNVHGVKKDDILVTIYIAYVEKATNDFGSLKMTPFLNFWVSLQLSGIVYKTHKILAARLSGFFLWSLNERERGQVLWYAILIASQKQQAQ